MIVTKGDLKKVNLILVIVDYFNDSVNFSVHLLFFT